MRKLEFLFLFIFCIILNCYTSFASEDKYRVDNIRISAESINSSKAKDLAIQNGEREALKILFKNLNVDESNSRFITLDMLTQMVESIQISNEVLSNTKYSAILTVIFNKNFVHYNLDNLGLNKKNSVITEKYLYIPILKQENKYFVMNDNIFGEKTIQAKDIIAFENRIDFSKLNISILNNNPLNAAIFTVGNIDEIGYDNLAELLKIHNSNAAIFSIAEYSKDTDSINVVLREYFADSVAETKLNMFNAEKLTYEDLIADVAKETFKYILKTKITNFSKYDKFDERFSEYSNTGELDVVIFQKDLNELVFFENLLKNLSFIKSSFLKNLTTKEAVFNIKINVNFNELTSLFKENGILFQLKNGRYYLVYVGL